MVENIALLVLWIFSLIAWALLFTLVALIEKEQNKITSRVDIALDVMGEQLRELKEKMAKV